MLKSTKIQYDFYPLNVSISKKYENFIRYKFTFGVKKLSKSLHLTLIGITKKYTFYLSLY